MKNIYKIGAGKLFGESPGSNISGYSKISLIYLCNSFKQSKMSDNIHLFSMIGIAPQELGQVFLYNLKHTLIKNNLPLSAVTMGCDLYTLFHLETSI
jgi:hypothetical protein